MQFYPTNLADWVDVITKGLATLFVLVGGGWGLYQYFKGTRVKAAETLLKVEEEFRCVFPTYEEIDDDSSYETVIKPVLIKEAQGTLDGTDLKKLTEIDRCLRFLYLCSILNDMLRVDRMWGVKEGAIDRAYYYYIGIMLDDVSRDKRPELLAYAHKYYPRLTEWAINHHQQLMNVRSPVAQ